jgi:hypothetical protein
MLMYLRLKKVGDATPYNLRIAYIGWAIFGNPTTFPRDHHQNHDFTTALLG